MKVCPTCGDEFTRHDSLNRHMNTVCEPPESWDVCPECNKSYKDIGNHYQYNKSHRPPISEKQHEIIQGVLMGDGWIGNRSNNPRFQVSMVTKPYISYLQRKLSPFSSDIYERPMRDEKLQQQYSIQTIVHPELEKYSNWYSSGEKVYPKNLNITPCVLRHWYVTDGGIYGKNNYPQIRCWKERKNIEKVEEYFGDTPLNSSFSSGTLRFPSSKEEFFEYIGWEPLPGFKHKWPNVE